MTQTKTRDSFIFYRSFFYATKKLTKEDKAELFDAICTYALDGELVEMSAIPDAIFSVIQPNLDANRRRWENGCKEKKKNNNKQKISKDEAKDKQKISKSEGNKDKDKDKDKDVNENLNEESKSKSKSESKFIKPALQEIQAYCQERKNNVNAEKFFDYYQANGWKVGKNPMKDWKAAVRTWEKNEKTTNNKEDFSIYSKY